MTSQQLQSEMDRLQEVAVVLEARTEDLNRLIEQMSYRLEETEIGVASWIESEDMPGWRFGYAKVGREWTLSARKEREEPISLTNSPRRLRLEAMRRVKELIKLLADKAQQFLDDVERATSIAEKSIEEI